MSPRSFLRYHRTIIPPTGIGVVRKLRRGSLRLSSGCSPDRREAAAVVADVPPDGGFLLGESCVAGVAHIVALTRNMRVAAAGAAGIPPDGGFCRQLSCCIPGVVSDLSDRSDRSSVSPFWRR